MDAYERNCHAILNWLRKRIVSPVAVQHVRALGKFVNKKSLLVVLAAELRLPQLIRGR